MFFSLIQYDICYIFAIEKKSNTNKQTQTTNQLVIKNMLFSLITVGTIWYMCYIFAIERKQRQTNKHNYY